jgi:hypothetical protein
VCICGSVFLVAASLRQVPSVSTVIHSGLVAARSRNQSYKRNPGSQERRKGFSWIPEFLASLSRSLLPQVSGILAKKQDVTDV